MTKYIINPLFSHSTRDKSTSPRDVYCPNKFQWQIIDRIVTALPYSHTDRRMIPDCSGEIEVSMEEYVSCSPEVLHVKPLQRRIAVRPYGPMGDRGLIHASFSIPIDELPPCHSISTPSSKNWMCWATIHDNLLNKRETVLNANTETHSSPGKAYLCALTGPRTIRIYDVYPNVCGNKTFEGAGGASDCHSITLDFTATSIFPLPLDKGGILIQRAFSDQEFHHLGAPKQPHQINLKSSLDIQSDIQGPPSTIRIGSVSNQPQIDTSFKSIQATNSVVHSLYTLHHPLDEVNHCVFDYETSSNVFEKVIFLRRPRNFTENVNLISNNILLVTYNHESKLHSLWVAHEAPLPPPMVPLWKQSNSASSFSSNSHAKKRDNYSSFDFDLGLQQERYHQNVPNLLDTNYRLSIRLIHTMNTCEEQSENVFLATTEDATGDFILCLSIKFGTSKHDSLLRCIVLTPPDDDSNSQWKIKESYDIPCLSAQPIYSTKLPPRPFRFIDGKKYYLQNEMQSDQRCVDILVCQDPRLRKLRLYRGQTHVIDFSIGPKTDFHQLLPNVLSNPVGDRVDIMFTHIEEKISKILRFTFSTDMKGSGLTDTAMAAVGSSLVHSSYSNESTCRCFIALQSDLSILSQAIASRQINQYHSEDAEWNAFTVIVSYLFVQVGGGGLDGSSASLYADINMEEDHNDWNKMMNSNFHRTFICGERLGFQSESSNQLENSVSSEDLLFLSSSKTSEWLTSNDSGFSLLCGRMIFDSLYILYEDFRCRRGSVSNNACIRLGQFLFSVSQSSISSKGIPLMEDYSKIFLSDLNIECSRCKSVTITPTIPKRLSLSIVAPCILRKLEACISSGEITWNDHVNGACKSSGMLLWFYSILFSKTSNMGYDDRKQQLAVAMTDVGLYNQETLMELFPIAIAIPLLDALYWCRANPPEFASPLCYDLINRKDLNKTKRKDVHPYKNLRPNPDISQYFPSNDLEHDGLIAIQAFSAMMFPYDSRIKEAAKLLRSSRPVFLRINRQPEVSDHEYERLKQQQLAMLCRRLLPLPVGRGMLTFGTTKTLPVEPVLLPKLCLAGRVPPNDTVVFLEDARCQSKHKMWPEFHNGVAAGLRLPLASSDGVQCLSRTWIICNNPKTPTSISTSNQTNPAPPEPEANYSFGGLLLALGLRGHLSSLSNTDILDYLNSGSITTAVGILLGLAAGKRGTSDVVVRKTLCVHIPSLFPTSFRSIDLAVPLQTAAVMGVGLLYQGSSDRLLSEFLLNEIGKRVSDDQFISDREGYSLCCGLSLGLVNLCLRGRSRYDRINDGLSDLNMEEILFRYINGGIDEISLKQKDLDHQRKLLNINCEDEKSSRVFEGVMINTGLTSPGASLALGLIYHRSGNASVSSFLALPSTLFAMDRIRPDFLMIRTIARFLVLWDDISPSHIWVEKQIPSIIKTIYKKLMLRANKLSGFGENSNRMIPSTIEESKLSDFEEDILEIDHLAIRQSYMYVVAGLCFSIGLKYAGSGNEMAAAAITHYVLELQKIRDESDPISSALRPDKSTIEMCLGSVAISLSMVMAGTGDLKVFNILRILRQKCAADVKFGNHMAYACAIGLLFLGGGTCTLGNDPSDIAVLLISFYPIFPTFTHDNQYHLQALRHMYSLAVKERKLVVIDVDSNEEVLIPVKISYDVDGEVDVMAPCLILNKGKTCKIVTNTDRYYQVKIVVENISELNRVTVIYVKKKPGLLSYVQDPHGLRSLFWTISAGNESLIDIMLSFTDDRRFRAYAKHICNISEHNTCDISRSLDHCDSLARTNKNIYDQAIKEALRQRKVDAIFIYLALFESVQESKMKSTQNVWSLKLLRTFYEHNSSFNVVDPQFVAMLCEEADRVLARFESKKQVENVLRIWNN